MLEKGFELAFAPTPEAPKPMSTGNTVSSDSSPEPLMRREMHSLRPPFLELSLSGTDFGRIWPFQVWSGLGSVGYCPRFQRGISLVGNVPFSDLESVVIIGDFAGQSLGQSLGHSALLPRIMIKACFRKHYVILVNITRRRDSWKKS